MHDDGAVEDPVAVDERRADDEQRAQVGARPDHGPQPLEDRVEQRVGEQQVVDGVAAQAQLVEDGDGDALLVAGPGLLDEGRRVARGVGDGDGHRAGGDPANPCAYAEAKSTSAHPPVPGVEVQDRQTELVARPAGPVGVEGVLDGVRLGDDDDLAGVQALDLGAQLRQRVVGDDLPGGGAPDRGQRVERALQGLPASARASVRSTGRSASRTSFIRSSARSSSSVTSRLRRVSAGTRTR